MGLFTNPVTISDGTSDHIFNYYRQLPDTKYIGAEYIEEAADPAARSNLIVKHDLNGPVPRHLFQRNCWVHPAADTDSDDLQRITWNITGMFHPLFSEAEIQLQKNIAINATLVANFVKSIQRNLI